MYHEERGRGVWQSIFVSYITFFFILFKIFNNISPLKEIKFVTGWEIYKLSACNKIVTNLS